MSANSVALQHVYACMKPEGVSAAQNRIWYGAVPDAKARYPLVLIQTWGESVDVRANGFDNPTIMTTVTMQIRVVGEYNTVEDLDKIFTLYDLVHKHINATYGTYQEGTVIDCERIAEVDMPEVVNGRTYQYQGGRYQLNVQAA